MLVNPLSQAAAPSYLATGNDITAGEKTLNFSDAIVSLQQSLPASLGNFNDQVKTLLNDVQAILKKQDIVHFSATVEAEKKGDNKSTTEKIEDALKLLNGPQIEERRDAMRNLALKPFLATLLEGTGERRIYNAQEEQHHTAVKQLQVLCRSDAKNTLQAAMLQSFPNEIPSDANAPSPWQPGSDFDSFWSMQQQIGQINTNYIKPYQNIVAGYTQFFTDLNSAIGLRTNFLSASTESGKIVFDYKGFKSAFDAAMSKYNAPNPYLLTEISYYPNSTEAQKAETLKYWQNNLGPDFIVKDEGGVIKVYLNTQVIKDMSDGISSAFNGSDNTMMQQKYNSWETTFTGKQSDVNNSLRRVIDLYAQSNRIFDNLSRILTSAFQACVDTAKDFLRV